MVQLIWGVKWMAMASCLAVVTSIPTSLVDEIKVSELKNNKVKRAHPDINVVKEHVRNVPYFSKPTATKRGTNLKNPSTDQQSLNEWEQEQALYQNADALANIQSTLYNGGESSFDDKTIGEYEKGFHYGTNKEKLDEALENAVLKSELYGEPSSVNQYRYYGEERKRRRRQAKKNRSNELRFKREVMLTPEELLTILTLYDREQARPYDPEDFDQQQQEVEEESWLDGPVYPHSINDIAPTYQGYSDAKRGRWNGMADIRRKRFMVAKKRNDPTRELRYMNGPTKNDFYTLSQLLSNQREPNVPLYHRLVL